MNFKTFERDNQYETPSVMEMELVPHDLLCTSTFTELEKYNFMDEQAW